MYVSDITHQTENNQGILLRILYLDIDLACLICQWSRLPEPWEVAFLIATALVLAIINLLIWKFVLRNSSTMNRKLQLFTKHKASDEKRITKAKMEKSFGGWFLLGIFFLIFLYVFFNGSLDGFFGSCRCKMNANPRFLFAFSNSEHLRESNTRRYPGVVSEGFGCGRFWTFTSISSRTFETETWAKEMPRSWGSDGQVMVSTVRLVVFPLILDVGWCHWLFINLPKKLVLLNLQVFPSQSASLCTVFRMCAALICCSFSLYLRRLWRGFRSAWHKLLRDAHPEETSFFFSGCIFFFQRVKFIYGLNFLIFPMFIPSIRRKHVLLGSQHCSTSDGFGAAFLCWARGTWWGWFFEKWIDDLPVKNVGM